MNYALHQIDFREVAIYLLVHPLDLGYLIYLAKYFTYLQFLDDTQ